MNVKPLFLKTYGKQKRKLCAWISPENHKRAFDSTSSTDSDVSVFEPPKPTKTRKKRTSVASHRVTRPARKKKAVPHLMNTFDEKNISREPNVENVSSYSSPAQQSKTRRRKKTVCSNQAVRPAKRKVLSLTKTSDEENVCKPSPTHHQQIQQSKTARRSKLVSEPEILRKHKPDQVPGGSFNEKDSMSAPQSRTKSFKMKRHSNVPSVGRFVTRRRCGAATKNQHPKERVRVLNSSDEFSSGAFSANRNLRPFRRSRVPPAFILSSAENSVNVAGASCVATKPLQEISLNESSDHSIGPCSRKPIFCSTPSACSLRKHPHRKPFPVNDLPSMPLSMSVSCIGSLSPFQKDVDTSGPIASQHSVPPTWVYSPEKQHLDLSKKETALHHHDELSGDLFMESKNTNTSEDNKNHSEDLRTKSSEELPCLNLLSTNNESSSNFVTTAGELEWLIETLKEKCLTEHCTVALERLDIPSMTQLCSQTTYSSCLGDEYFLDSLQTNEHPVSVDSSQSGDLQRSSEELINLCLSVTDHRFDYSEPPSSLHDSQSSNISPSVDWKLSAECSSSQEIIKQSASVVYDQSVHHTNSSAEFTMSTQESTSNALQTEDVEAVKDKCPIKKCRVQLKKMNLSQLKFEQLKGFAQQNESHLTCNDGSSDPNAKTDHTPSDLVYLGAMQSNAPETKTVRMSTKRLMGKCLSEKLTVDVKRVTLSELKDMRNAKDRKPKSAVSDPAGDNHSASDTHHCKEDTSTVKANKKKKSITHSNDKISSDTEGILPTRRKLSLARKDRKRRSASTDRPGTTRKACVSGLSVNRWKNKSSMSTHMFRSQTAQSGHVKAVDCSIDELISTQHKRVLGPTMNFSTPVRASTLNLSSVLSDLTPNSYTWSRLKAALSVHRKGMVLLTPRTVAASGSPGRATLADISKDLFATPLRTPLPKHLQSQLCRNESLVACEDLSDAEKVYAECGQPRPLPWEECILPHRMKRCVKIGEGTFGEVFSTTNASGDTVALKIIPVEGSEKVNGEDQKTFGEILHEIIISKELSSLKEKQHNQTHSFIGLNDLHCVQGCYPPDFLNAWDRFDQQKGSENDRPDFFQRDQIFIILEFEFGGIDLENSNGTLASLGVAKSILHQVTAALAVAEQELHFEHRDLHWGNILVKTTKQKMGSFLLKGVTHSLETKGVLVRIIDYSLSRLEIDELTVSCDISKDEELFMGQGDYQFEIYRLMRKENGNNWSDYHPHTNVLWLHYLCSKLLYMKYRCAGGRGAKEIREELTRFSDGVLHYSSATQVLQHCPMFQ